MTKQSIFISCGQYTEAEKRLGKQIAAMVKTLTGLEPFFAEEVQDLNGLDANILGALHDCVAFITVMHPRGEIKRPDSSVINRTSVWIEQEIAVATYIQRVEKRPLPIIVFKHKRVDREGIRDLLHLNPIEFTDESEVLAALPERLKGWKYLKPTGIELRLNAEARGQEDGHTIRALVVTLVNDTDQRIREYYGRIWIPAGTLKHWSGSYALASSLESDGSRCFKFDEVFKGPINPRDNMQLATFNYCPKCALEEYGEISLVASAKMRASIWIGGQQYSIERTIQELAEEVK